MKRWHFTVFGVVILLLAVGAPVPFAQPEAAEGEGLSREERIRQHREHIKEIIEKRREQRAQAGEQQPEPGTAAVGRPAVPAGAAAARGAPVPGGRPPASQGGGAGTESGSPMGSQIRIDNCLLYMKPLDSIAAVGERFVTRIQFDNPSDLTVDALSIVLRYDPRLLRCVRVFDDQFRPLIVSPPTFESRPRNGLVIYEAKLRKPRVLQKMTLITVIWEAVRPSQYTEIEFDFLEGGPSTAVLSNGKDVLGFPEDPFDGVIGGSVLIRKPEAVQTTDFPEVNRDQVVDFFTGVVNPEGKARLALGAPDDWIHVDDEFEVPIFLMNPNGLVLDSVSLFIKFDPEVLEVVDSDDGNWIRRGVNIHDGDRHDAFPFDYFIRNEALNGLGVIDYRLGQSGMRTLPSGRLATIRFRAIAPSPRTTVELVRREKGEKPNTRLSMHGEDYLDLSPPQSRPSLTFPVYPERADAATIDWGQ
jgi:hypothetical protein